jgi:hypothetical protein
MCIKIFYSQDSKVYDAKEPLTDQLRGCKEIIIDYDSKDSSIDTFMDEVEKLCDSGLSMKLNIRVLHKNQIKGAATKRRVTRLSFQTELNDFIKMMALSHAEADKKLEELSEMCSGKNE